MIERNQYETIKMSKVDPIDREAALGVVFGSSCRFDFELRLYNAMPKKNDIQIQSDFISIRKG